MTAIEYPYSTTTGYGPLTAGSYSVAVRSAKLFIATAKISIPDSISTLRLTEFLCMAKPMSTATNGSFNWTVKPSTRAIYMFLQDSSAGSNPIIPPGVFRVYGTTADPAVLPAAIGEEQTINDLRITYANTTKPQWRLTSEFTSSKNLLTQLYMQSLIETEMADSVGGVETMDQWLQRGPLYCWRFERDASDRSTEVQTDISFNNLIASTICASCRWIWHGRQGPQAGEGTVWHQTSCARVASIFALEASRDWGGAMHQRRVRLHLP